MSEWQLLTAVRPGKIDPVKTANLLKTNPVSVERFDERSRGFG